MKFTYPLVKLAGMSCIALALTLVGGCSRQGDAKPMSSTQKPDAGTDVSQPADPPASTEIATFGAGCFWGVEAAFRQVKGVTATAVGYSGGTMANPTYRDVCSDRTGHVEVVRVDYDPDVVSYDDLLNVFWTNHDPTQVNRQGPDVGGQYRSVIFYHNDVQAEAARASKEKLEQSKRFSRPIATQIEPAAEFYRAEEYHQQYLEKRGLASCHIP